MNQSPNFATIRSSVPSVRFVISPNTPSIAETGNFEALIPVTGSQYHSRPATTTRSSAGTSASASLIIDADGVVQKRHLHLAVARRQMVGTDVVGCCDRRQLVDGVVGPERHVSRRLMGRHVVETHRLERRQQLLVGQPPVAGVDRPQEREVPTHTQPPTCR